jgi:hypothetical protein
MACSSDSQEDMTMLATAHGLPVAIPGQAWSVVLGPLAGLAAVAVLAVFVFLVAGALLELGARARGISEEEGDTEPEPVTPRWRLDERMVA